jgi:hypothetical protein
MIKQVTCLITFLFLSVTPVSAETILAEACNHNTGDCYRAEVDSDERVVTIELSDNNQIILEFNNDYPDDLTAYDEKNQVYYDIEILK